MIIFEFLDKFLNIIYFRLNLFVVKNFGHVKQHKIIN